MAQFNRRSGAKVLPALLGGLAAYIGFLAVAPLPADAAVAKLIHVGRAVTVVNDFLGKIGNQPTKRIIVNERLFFNQRMITTGESRGVVEFHDGSVLRVGPDSVVSLDRFVFNPFESRSEKVITVLSGAFRYVSGMKMKSSSLEIRTPTATIGIRESAGEGAVIKKTSQNEGATYISLDHGTGSIKNNAGSTSLRAGQKSIITSRNQKARTGVRQEIAAVMTKAINNSVGGGRGLTGAPTLTTQEAKADVDANGTSSGDQASQQITKLASVDQVLTGTGTGKDLQVITNLVNAAKATGLLGKADNAPLTQAQTNLANKTKATVPNAAQILKTATAAAAKSTQDNGDRATAKVVKDTAKLFDNKADVIKLVEAVAKADPDRTGLVAKSAAEGAPDMAIIVVGAAVNANPDKAADIGADVTKSFPNLAGAFAAVLIKANPSAAGKIAAEISKSAPDKVNDVVAVAMNLVPGSAGNVIAAIGNAVKGVDVASLLTGISPAAGGGIPPVSQTTSSPPIITTNPPPIVTENPNQTVPVEGGSS